MILKNIDDLEYHDIQSLLDNKIPESIVLDYKEMIPDDSELLKHVDAFGNTNGGHIVFGVEESGDGGYPVAINGIESKSIIKERIENVILSNIFPRLQIKQKIIDNENGNPFLVIQIPKSAFKPHFNHKAKKFFKRFEFQSVAMEEHEISNMYKNRFYTLQDSKEYLHSLSNIALGKQIIKLQIIIVPTLLEPQLIDTTDDEIYEWLNPNHISYKPYVGGHRNGFLPTFAGSHQVGISFVSPQRKDKLFIHRNGSIDYTDDVGYERERDPHILDETINKVKTSHIAILNYNILAIKLMQVFQFADDLLSRYNYFGDVNILVKLTSRNVHWGIKWGNWEGDTQEIAVALIDGLPDAITRTTLEFERNYPASFLKKNHSKITASIMDEIYNCFGIRKCILFDEKGQYIPKND